MKLKVITAPEQYIKEKNDIYCFLAGGIQNCKEWQNEIITSIKEFSNNPDNLFEFLHNNPYTLVLFNPRRPNFPIHDPNAAEEQITWEYKWLEQMDIFSMYFDGPTKSDQPICFYELGRHLSEMKIRFPNDFYKRIVIGVSPDFKRCQDVIIQTKLATNNLVIPQQLSYNNIKSHAISILTIFSNICYNK